MNLKDYKRFKIFGRIIEVQDGSNHQILTEWSNEKNSGRETRFDPISSEIIYESEINRETYNWAINRGIER